MKQNKYAYMITGATGGVARSFLSILEKAMLNPKDPLHSFVLNATFHLVDIKTINMEYYRMICPNLTSHIKIHTFNILYSTKLHSCIVENEIEIVVDCATVDSLSILRVCNELGVKYVNTAIEVSDRERSEMNQEETIVEINNNFHDKRRYIQNTTAIVGSGMNPGVVQWMVTELLNQNPNEKPLACYIVEEDTGFIRDEKKISSRSIYLTWSPQHYIEEAVINKPMYMKEGEPQFLLNKKAEYTVSLGEKVFEGSLVPHDEVISLGKIYDFELGFIYRVNNHTRSIIRKNIEQPEKLNRYRKEILQPYFKALTGGDLVGVLMVYGDREVYMYNMQNNEEISATYGTNATYFQVACGLYASFASLILDNLPHGVFYIEELVQRTESEYGKYLREYMKDIVTGENPVSQGYLHNRMKE